MHVHRSRMTRGLAALTLACVVVVAAPSLTLKAPVASASGGYIYNAQTPSYAGNTSTTYAVTDEYCASGTPGVTQWIYDYRNNSSYGVANWTALNGACYQFATVTMRNLVSGHTYGTWYCDQSGHCSNWYVWTQ